MAATNQRARATGLELDSRCCLQALEVWLISLDFDEEKYLEQTFISEIENKTLTFLVEVHIICNTLQQRQYLDNLYTNS